MREENEWVSSVLGRSKAGSKEDLRCVDDGGANRRQAGRDPEGSSIGRQSPGHLVGFLGFGRVLARILGQSTMYQLLLAYKRLFSFLIRTL